MGLIKKTCRGAAIAVDLRDYYAAHASEKDICEWQFNHHGVAVRSREEAKFLYADAMMKARVRRQHDRQT